MAELKTKPTGASVDAFLRSIPDEGRRKDCTIVSRMMSRATGSKPRMWGPSIVGFGTHHYSGSNGKSVEWFQAGFSPRKANLTLYLMSGFSGKDSLMGKLGKHTTGKSCLYIKKLDDVELDVLEALIEKSVEQLKR
jgi:hypothetical protein